MWESLWADMAEEDRAAEERDRADRVGRTALFWAVCVSIGFILGVVLAGARLW